MPLDFLRSRACAEMSPYATKLLLDVLALLKPNAKGNGDLCLTPKQMAVRGWTSKATLHAAVAELEEHGLLVRTRQGGRLDCSLFALTLYPLACDPRKLEVGPGCYATRDFERKGMGAPPTEQSPARWRTARRSKALAPVRNDRQPQRTGAERQQAASAALRTGAEPNPPISTSAPFRTGAPSLDTPSAAAGCSAVGVVPGVGGGPRPLGRAQPSQDAPRLPARASAHAFARLEPQP